ncbi:MAG: hypothetical protein HY075_12050 [Deltaproteobacteria bacterium]|nr:hypothetical protein [Deltaproteobacteria bacterium]
MAGMLGCYATFNTLSFAGINEKAGAEGASCAMICLIVGTMLRNLQMPLMQNARNLAAARSSATPVFFIGHAIVSSALFAKIYPALMATDGIQYLAVIPALTAIAAALLALPEEDPFMFIGWLVSYVCSSVYLSGLAGHYQAAHALALTGSVAAFLFACALSEFAEEDRTMKWFVGVAMLVLTGLPISGWGWARYLEYAGLFHNEAPVPPFHWVMLGMKILADIFMGIALWGVVRERWMVRESAARIKWDVIVPLTIVGLACIAASVGGRASGGLAGEADLNLFAGAAWFEKLIVAPVANGAKAAAGASELIGTDADIFARLSVVGSLLIPALLAGLWIFRDRKSLEEFRSFCRRAIRKLGQVPGQDPKLWTWVIRPLSGSLGRAAAFFDSNILDRAFADIWARPARMVRNAFIVIEKNIIDGQLIDGLAEAVASIGKSLRLVQNGQVQFYFALGLILMGAVIVKFVVVGG